MPGVIMENAGVDRSLQHAGSSQATNGAPNHERSSQFPASTNRPAHVNGTRRDTTTWNQSEKPPVEGMGLAVAAPFELPHITQGFFPFGILVNRAVQQCWNDLSELVTELASIQVSSDSTLAPVNGKLPGNQSVENVHKKVRILDFAHAKRAEFIKLLVLSQWSRQAAEVSRLIDIQGFIRTRHQAYTAAVQYVGEMKRDLVRAQVANPDLKTALEVLAKGKVVTLPHLGYKPPKPLTAKLTLKKLRKINRIISVRLAVHDEVPSTLRNYRVHDGRVTFNVPGEFELDLSIAEEATSSQFYFVDIRFLFTPSSPIPKGRVFDELDAQINETLHHRGLKGCFDFLHGLVLTNKINTLFRQATDLARTMWSGALRIELLHRTLVLQYWTARTGPKSWLEIGVERGQRINETYRNTTRVPQICIRWMRDGQQANTSDIRFDCNNLSVESLLRSVIATHTSHLLFITYASLKRSILFSNHVLSLRAHLSPTEPSDCFLDVQLTPTRNLRASVEPLSGSITLSSGPNMQERPEADRISNKSAVEEILTRVTRLRCATAVEEIESGIKSVGLENVGQRGLGLDIRRIFPANTVRSVFFTHSIWDRRWVAAATSSMDGDSWWLVPIRVAESDTSHTSPAHLVSSTLVPTQACGDYSARAEILHGLTGMLSIYTNARVLAEIPGMGFYPPLEKIQLGPEFQVPNVLFRYRPSTLPPALRIASAPGLESRSRLKKSIRLSFHGIDHQNQSVVLMAYGTTRHRVKSLLPLVSKLDSSLLMQNKECGFVLRLLVPAGQSIIVGLLERLQRLDCLLSILQSLVQKQMRPSRMTLSQLAFVYGDDKKLTGRFDIDVSGPRLSDHVDISRALSNPEPLFRLHLKISFDAPSPHRRIQQSLTVALNHRLTKAGVDSVLQSMRDTSPLLQCVEQITKSPPTESSIVHVIVRSPTVFQLHYPRLNCRFRLSMRLRQQKDMVWLLENSPPSNMFEKSASAAVVREKIYNLKGDGWQGLGNGATSDLEQIGSLLSELHSCLGSCQPESNQQELGNNSNPPDVEQYPQTSVLPGPGKQEPAPLRTTAVLGKADVITID